MYSIHVTPGASDDLLKIVDYITNQLFNVEAAAKLVGEFEKLIKTLRTHPYLYVIHESEVIETEFRKATIGNYLVFYTVIEQNVYISFIMHQKQDYDNILVDVEVLGSEQDG